MEKKVFKPRIKQSMTVYMELDIWNRFGLACHERQTTRGIQITAFVEAKMAEWDAQKKGER